MKPNQIDEVIKPVAKHIPFCANVILDLRSSILNRQHPGKCVACFFKILAPACQMRQERKMDPLKNWLEENLEIVITNEFSTELERLSVKLLEDNLETYCQKIISQIHYDRSYASKEISLYFEFKELKAA